MDCCGHVHGSMDRAPMWSPALVSVEAMLAGEPGPAGSTEPPGPPSGRRLPWMCSADRFQSTCTRMAERPGSRRKRHRVMLWPMRCARDHWRWLVLPMCRTCRLLGRTAEGALAMVRAPATGELYRYHLDRLAWMDELVANHGMRRALCAADLEEAHHAGQPAIIADVEGLDFLDGKLERLEHQRGLRHLQLVHYTPNDIGDFQTGAVTHHGLTEFGAEVIRSCHWLGFVCDVAHATEDMAMQAIKVATKPLLLSHTALAGSPAMGPTPLAARQISSDHARAIAETGGSIGIWHFFPSLDRYVEGIKGLADIVGVDHVSIGTDQFDARGCVEDYTRWVHLITAMLRGGFTSEETGKIAGGNYLRIFCAAVG